MLRFMNMEQPYFGHNSNFEVNQNSFDIFFLWAFLTQAIKLSSSTTALEQARDLAIKRVSGSRATKFVQLRVQHSTMVSRLASGYSCPRFDSQHSQNYFRRKIVGVAEVNQWRW